MGGSQNVCAITGANGYVGGRIRDYFIQNGWTVYALTRDPTKSTAGNRSAVAYSLEENLNPGVLGVLEKSDLLIHCAYDFRPVDWHRTWEVNVNGSVRLLDGAKSAGVKKIVVISTMSAFEGCKSRYGMAKLAIEKEALQRGAVVIRPGLVFGRSPGGMVGALKKIISLSKFVPLIGKGDQILHLAHENDLCRLIFKVATDQAAGVLEPILAASEKGRTFRDVVQVLATIQGKKVTFIPLPWRVPWSGVKLLELLRFHIGFRSDSIISLVNLDPKPSFEFIKRIGLAFRDFNSQTAAS